MIIGLKHAGIRRVAIKRKTECDIFTSSFEMKHREDDGSLGDVSNK